VPGYLEQCRQLTALRRENRWLAAGWQNAALSRSILASGWGLLVSRLEDNGPGRVQQIHPRFTSQRCSACAHTSAENRKSPAVFACSACGFACNADVNATAAGGCQVL
jgi:transposase